MRNFEIFINWVRINSIQLDGQGIKYTLSEGVFLWSLKVEAVMSYMCVKISVIL